MGRPWTYDWAWEAPSYCHNTYYGVHYLYFCIFMKLIPWISSIKWWFRLKGPYCSPRWAVWWTGRLACLDGPLGVTWPIGPFKEEGDETHVCALHLLHQRLRRSPCQTHDPLQLVDTWADEWRSLPGGREATPPQSFTHTHTACDCTSAARAFQLSFYFKLYLAWYKKLLDPRYTHIYKCIYNYIRIDKYISMYKCVCIYEYMYIYMYI